MFEGGLVYSCCNVSDEQNSADVPHYNCKWIKKKKVSSAKCFILYSGRRFSSCRCFRLEMPKDEVPNHNCIKHLRSVVQQQQTKIADLEKTAAEHKHQLAEQVSPKLSLFISKPLRAPLSTHTHRHTIGPTWCMLVFYTPHTQCMLVFSTHIHMTGPT